MILPFILMHKRNAQRNHKARCGSLSTQSKYKHFQMNINRKVIFKTWLFGKEFFRRQECT